MEIVHPSVLQTRASGEPVDLRQWVPGIISMPVFSPVYCGYLIDKAERLDAYDAVEDDWERSTAGRIGKEVGVGRLEEGERIFEVYTTYILPAIKTYYRLELEEILEPFVIKYSLEGITNMARHKDQNVKVSGVVRLNDGYRGCRLRFPDQDVDAGDIPIGHMVLFPPSFDHEVTELESGQRFSLAFWSR